MIPYGKTIITRHQEQGVSLYKDKEATCYQARR